VGYSTPNFGSAFMLIFLFSIELGWLPASGYVPPLQNWPRSLASTIMPAFVLRQFDRRGLMLHTAAMLQVRKATTSARPRKELSERLGDPQSTPCATR